jgi:hypothetical protein
MSLSTIATAAPVSDTAWIDKLPDARVVQPQTDADRYGITPPAPVIKSEGIDPTIYVELPIYCFFVGGIIGGGLIVRNRRRAKAMTALQERLRVEPVTVSHDGVIDVPFREIQTGLIRSA